MLQIEQVISEAYNWILKISEQYQDILKINIQKYVITADKKILMVDFENHNYIAQLIINNDIDMKPYKFCEFRILDVNQDIYQEDAYCYWDNVNSNIEEILEGLNNGLKILLLTEIFIN
ncbi:MAG: hypothetical protein K2K06_02260 [Oscillospiraceae bacterium]|nr:hypothetical protein [Oscillospiraceae bacterium]